MDVKLVVIAGKASKRLVQLQLPTVVGRSREADVTVAHPMISRRHCEIYEQDGLLMLRDMASLNGTLIGGRKIILAPLLPQGEFTIGPIGFRVLYEFSGDVAAVPETEYALSDSAFSIPAAEAVPVEFSDLPEAESHEAESHGAESPEAESIDKPWMNSTEFQAWADVEDAAPPAQPAPEPSPAQPAQAKPAAPPNAHPLRNLSIPRDKLPTVPLPEPSPTPHADSPTPTISPWNDGTPSKPTPPHGGEQAAEDDFGNFLEGLQ